MVSVVTVCFNAENDIKKTIQSVLSQSFFDFEYIIKDGESNDRTNRVIARYRDDFQNNQISMKHIITKDAGIYDAMNQAVSYCTGEWIIFMNAGDTFYDKYVLSDVFEKHSWNNVDVIYGHTFVKLSEKYAIIINHDSEYLNKEWSMNHQSIFERRELLKKYPFERNFKIVSDYDHLLRIYKTYTFAKHNAIISVMDREGVSNQQIVKRNKENALLEKKYAVKIRKRSKLGSIIREEVRKVLPALECFFYVKNSMKRTMRYIEQDKNGRR